MDKRTKNRAQRRRDQRRQAAHTVSFWTTTGGRVTVALVGVLVVAFVVYRFWPKLMGSTPPAPVAATKTAPATPPPTTSTTPSQPAPATPPPNPDGKLES